MKDFIPAIEFRAMRKVMYIMLVLIGIFTACGAYGYRMLNIFGTSEFKPDGPGTHTGRHGRSYYYHK
jgi:hypothetical protein